MINLKSCHSCSIDERYAARVFILNKGVHRYVLIVLLFDKEYICRQFCRCHLRLYLLMILQFGLGRLCAGQDVESVSPRSMHRGWLPR